MTEPNYVIEHRVTGGAELRISLPGVLPFLQLMKEQIMATQAEIAQGIADATAQLQAVAAQVAKVGSETAVTLQKVADLEVVIASLGGTVDPALQTAFDALKTQVQLVADATAAVDALVPDAPAAGG